MTFNLVCLAIGFALGMLFGPMLLGAFGVGMKGR